MKLGQMIKKAREIKGDLQSPGKNSNHQILNTCLPQAGILIIFLMMVLGAWCLL
jgi:hypothetical protein